MNIIVEDVSHDLQIKLKDYFQKLNAFIMIYTFLAILGLVIILIMSMNASTVMKDIIPGNAVFMGLTIKKLEPNL